MSSPPTLQLRLIAITVIIAIILPLILILLLPFTQMSIINYGNVSVESMTDEHFQSLLGLKFLTEPSTDPKTITRDRLPANTRVIPPGHMVTMDFDEKRLNVHLDAENKVKKIKRG